MQSHPLTAHAQSLVQLVREEKYIEAYEQYFHENARGVENFSYDGSDPVTSGRDNLITKAKKRAENKNTLSLEVSEPSVFNHNQCIVWMKIITKAEDGSTREDEEYVLYTRQGEKIIEERFFYIMPDYEGSDADQFARKFFNDLQQPDFKHLYKTYFADDAIGVEAWGDDQMPQITTGVDNLILKGEQREQGREMIDAYTKDLSLVNDHQFVVSMGVTTKMTETGKINEMNEYVLYTLDESDSKIIEERFFYTMD